MKCKCFTGILCEDGANFYKGNWYSCEKKPWGISLQMMMETLIILHLLDFVCFSHGNETRILFANKIRISFKKGYKK